MPKMKIPVGIIRDPTPGDVLICVRRGEANPVYASTNKHGKCADCQTSIEWRPHHTDDLIKVCLECGLKRMNGDDISGVGVTEATAAEVLDHLMPEKNKNN